MQKRHATAEPKTTTVLTYEYRIRTNKKFVAACEVELEHARHIYNAALAERISCYQITGQSLNFVAQSRSLTDARTLPEVKAHLRTIQSDALERLDESFAAFFKRCAKGEGKPGFPRFKGRDRYHTFSQKLEPARACPLRGDKLTVPGVGSCRVRLSRPFEGKVKQLRITRRADGWYALLVCERPKPEPLPATGESIGIDVGLTSFASLSNGDKIDNPRHLQAASDDLTKHSRRLSKKKKGSANRRKARQKVALCHLKVQRARKHFHHEEAAKLVKRFDSLAVEDLNIRGMLKNHHLAKAISSVSWNAFFGILKSKAENAGREFEKVPAAYTSQECSACGHRQKMPLKLRIFVCGSCGHSLDRDQNSAINIKSRGERLRTTKACGARQRVKKQERDGTSQLKPQRGGN
jgi:putative transposase